MNIAFVDCETTHLDAEIGEAWEVAVILREFEDDQHTDTEYVWQFAIDEAAADPEALRIGRYEQRNVIGSSCDCPAAFTEPNAITCMTRADAVQAVVNVLSGAVLVGSNPAFDDRFLRKLLGPGSAQWHYRPYDIVQLAAAKVGVQAAGPLPWSSRILSRAVGVEPPTEETAHTALGDARWARDVHDAAMVRQPFGPTLEDRARHAIGLYTQTAIELEDARRTLRDMHAAAIGMGFVGTVHGLIEDVAGVRQRAECAEAAIERVRERCQTVRDQAGPGGMINASQILGLLSLTWPDGNFEAPAPADAVDGPSRPVMTGETPCTCTLSEACDQCADDDQDEDDEEFEETGDADGDVFELISEIARRLRDATDEGEYHAVGLISDLANGRKTIAEAREELAEITFRHV